MFRKFVKTASIAVLALGSAVSQAAIIDFQDVPSGSCAGGGSTLTSRGFNFAGNPADPGLFICNAGVLQHNTSAALINANSRSILTMSQVGGGAFSLQSFFAGGRTRDFNADGAVSGYTVATGIQILGNVAGGGTVSQTITLDSAAPYDWAQFALSGDFNNLTSVMFSALGNGSTPEFVIDDIMVNNPQQQAVPEPASLALIGLGLAGISFTRRKKV